MKSIPTFDVGVCTTTNQKKKWNDACKDGFKLKDTIRGKPYIICENCVNWEGKTNFEQSRLDEDDKNKIKETIQSRCVVLMIL